MRYCNHLEPHKIELPTSERDKWIKEKMEELGWFRAGYCEAYYPQYVYEILGQEYDDNN